MPKNTDKKDAQATPTAGPAPQQSAAPTTPQPKGGKKAGAKSDKMSVGKDKDGKDSNKEKKKDV